MGSVFNADCDVAGAVDFDWAGMGVDYANWMAENHPGKDFVIITGNFESVPCQTVNKAMEDTANDLGKNKLLTIEDGDYTPAVAADKAEDLVNSGLEFGIIFVMDEDMAAAVRQRLEDMGVADNYVIISENGSDVGLEMINNGPSASQFPALPDGKALSRALRCTTRPSTRKRRRTYSITSQYLHYPGYRHLQPD